MTSQSHDLSQRPVFISLHVGRSVARRRTRRAIRPPRGVPGVGDLRPQLHGLHLHLARSPRGGGFFDHLVTDIA